MQEAAARLVRTIRLHYPSIKLMMNRGYDLLPEVEQQIDIVLGESVFATYDFKSKKYGVMPREQYQEQVKILQSAKQRRPSLQVFTLDYWDPNDRPGILRIYREERANGFAPYVSTIKLDRIVQEPQ